MNDSGRETDASFDWEKIRNRVAQAETDTGKLSPEAASELLDQRARRLAQATTKVEQARDGFEAVSFVLTGQLYAVAVRYLQEIAEVAEITPVPGAPDFVCGLTQGHGEAIAVFRLANLLGLGRAECSETASQMLIFGEDRIEFGAIVDEVRAFLTLNNDEILTSSESTADVTPAYVTGMTEGGLIVLNGAALLEDEGLWVNQTDALRR